MGQIKSRWEWRQKYRRSIAEVYRSIIMLRGYSLIFIILVVSLFATFCIVGKARWAHISTSHHIEGNRGLMR